MPVSRKSATAIVHVRGLGISCFNPKSGRNETAIIRSGNHRLKLGIYRPELLDLPGKDAFGYRPVAPEIEFEQSDGIEISIGVRSASRYDGYEIFRAGEFNRLEQDTNDENDIRWIVNLEGEELHGKRLAKNLEAFASRPPVTKLAISGGLFYAVMPTREHLAKTPFFMRRDPRNGAVEPFGYMAETMGVNLEADEVVVTVCRDGKSDETVLKRVDGLPFKIEISNVDPDPDAMASDLPVCYQFLRDPEGLEFELFPRDETSAGGPVIGKNYCHLAMSDQESIEGII